MKLDTTKLIAEAVANAKPGTFVCTHCGQAYTREESFMAHQCEPKRRVQQRNEVGVRLGLQTWIRFYELSQGSAKLKTYEDFAKSNLYTAFVKFGRYCHNIRVINFARFADFVLKNNIKIDHWCQEKIYDRYLIELLKTESAEDALARAIEHMQDWAEQNDAVFNDYFRTVSTNRLVQDIRNGRISAWCLYCCSSGMAALAQFNTEQINMVWPLIDSDYWQKKLKDYSADAELSKHVLTTAGL